MPDQRGRGGSVAWNLVVAALIVLISLNPQAVREECAA
jgi:hypothetical protein